MKKIVLRFISFYIDCVPIGLLFYGVLFVLTKFDFLEKSIFADKKIIYYYIPIFILYFFITESLFSTTLGKRIFSLEVKFKGNVTNKILAIFIRSISRLIPFDIISIFFRNDSRMFHDLLSKTYIEKRKSAPSHNQTEPNTNTKDEEE